MDFSGGPDDVFLPGMSSDIREYISKCVTCCKFTAEQPNEALMPHTIPNRPWKKVRFDILEFDSVGYLVAVNYFSNLYRLGDTTALTLIRKIWDSMSVDFRLRNSVYVFILQERFGKMDFWSPEINMQMAKTNLQFRVQNSSWERHPYADQYLVLLDAILTETQRMGGTPSHVTRVIFLARNADYKNVEKKEHLVKVCRSSVTAASYYPDPHSLTCLRIKTKDITLTKCKLNEHIVNDMIASGNIGIFTRERIENTLHFFIPKQKIHYPWQTLTNTH